MCILARARVAWYCAAGFRIVVAGLPKCCDLESCNGCAPTIRVIDNGPKTPYPDPTAARKANRSRMTTTRILSNRHSSAAAVNTPLSVNQLVVDLTARLLAAAELAAVERGRAIIDSVFSALASGVDAHLGKAAKLRADRERNRAVTKLTRQFLKAIAKPLRTSVRERIKRELASHSGVSGSATSASDAVPVRRRIRRTRPNRHLPPPLDPEQIKRDQEFARLRALLKPVAVETIVPLPAPIVVAPPVQPSRPASPGDVLRALEKEIQNAVPTLGTLGPERCGAQIAAWVGQVRGLRDRLAPDIAATMRPAFRIFLEHLTQLRLQMEAHVVDALEPNWKAPDWDAYVEVNRARALQQAPVLSIDRLHMHHRAMLRALVLPHRRNVPEQAAAIIEAAAGALHAEDSLLQSAIRRHRSTRPAQAPETPEGSPAKAPDASSVAQANSESVGVATAEVPAQATDNAPAAPVTAENEFDILWTK